MLRLLVSNGVVVPSVGTNAQLAADVNAVKGSKDLMKAILIDPVARKISGIEVEFDTLSKAFTQGRSTPVELTMLPLRQGLLIVDKMSRSLRPFAILGSGLSPIHSRGLLLGYERDGKGPCSTTLTVREVEREVRFL